ncbi:MAG TPA: zinc ribbon domain-containing protein [Spirochaetia bacterium]|nr:zinc ribbon domain-containing protein [Spirochaetia bacterium]
MMKEAVFYCESCNHPVPLESEVCPHCGSRFTAVQCPKCSFVGEAPQFVNGCPQCGYLSPEQKRTRVSARAATVDEVGARPARGVQKRLPAEPTKSIRRESRLPGWFYSLAAVLLLVVLAGLILLLFRLH